MLGIIGDLVEDVVVWCDGPVRAATDSAATVHRTRGGSAANVAAFAAGTQRTRFLGSVGSDVIGDWLVTELAGQGVDVRVRRQATTGTIVVLIDEHGERTMFPHRGAAVSLTDVPESWTQDLAHLHIPAYSFTGGPIATTTLELARTVHERGATVSVDASSTGMLREYGALQFLGLLGNLRPRFLLANRAEAEYLDLISGGRPGPALEGIARTTVVVKDGQHPSTVLRHGRQPLRVPVPPVEGVRDLTGAGDAFAAGFLTAFLRAAEPRACCEAGHASAATVLRSPGATVVDAGHHPPIRDHTNEERR